MILLKIISYWNKCDVEEGFNEWVAKRNPNITDIQFSTCKSDDSVVYSMAIFYTKD